MFHGMKHILIHLCHLETANCQDMALNERYGIYRHYLFGEVLQTVSCHEQHRGTPEYSDNHHSRHPLQLYSAWL